MLEVEEVFKVEEKILLKAYELMQMVKCMADTYEDHRYTCKYVHATAKGHEAIQLALGLQLKTYDYVSPYYRDDAMLLGMGFEAYDLMLQLLAKADDPFTAGRAYYSHPSSKHKDFPKIIQQSSATGMQVIPTTGVAQGIQYKEDRGLLENGARPVAVCSLGDGSVTEGEVAEAWQFAALKQLPILYLVQDNDWSISATGAETRSSDAYEYAGGFKGLKRIRVDGSDFFAAYEAVQKCLAHIREYRSPVVLHAKVPLLGHHTSGVRKEWYRDDLEKHTLSDPLSKLHERLLADGIEAKVLADIAVRGEAKIKKAFERAAEASNPDPDTLLQHVYAPAAVTEERGERSPEGGRKVLMVDAALYAMDEILDTYPEAIFYGQDVGIRLGGVFREAATLAQKYGSDRVFNTAIQEAYIVGSTAGMSAVGLKPIVEIQFADYFWPSMNQLVTEIAKSCYLSAGKYPVQTLIRVPAGAYGGGGPYHSACIESSILNIPGIKIVFPSNAADMKGLLKSAFLDPNPVILFEHKGLYWSKVMGTADAKTIEPSADYVIPLGKARIAQEASEEQLKVGNTVTVITYGMGVYWAKTASKKFEGSVEIVDLRTLKPLDEETIFASVKKHNKALVLTEEPLENSFAESLAGRISQKCFADLDAPVATLGAANVPAVPMNTVLEQAMLPNAKKVAQAIKDLLEW
ncbi:MAG: thiamine pyrophosphate-dependent enzyme [Chitinophagales bacterium]